jgi:type II secretory pathway pseudopilin PulG
MKYTIPCVTAVLLGTLAAIVTPNLRTAIGRSRQKRTMADIRSISTAWEARATDVNTYDVSPHRRAAMTPIAPSDLRRALEPTYLKNVPGRDAWNHPLQFAANGQDYLIRSSGADSLSDPGRGPTTSFDCDIVYSNGTFLEYPEGA